MTKREFRDFLQDILEAIYQLDKITQGITFKEFSTKIEILLAVVKLIEIIGEAVKNIPDEVRGNYPEIPWKNIAGMRDKLVHEYWAIDEQTVWKVIRKNLPQLKATITKIIEELQENEY
jgi:uncharacterized protein with HEPN domain